MLFTLFVEYFLFWHLFNPFSSVVFPFQVVCQHMGGDLVEIETAEESNYLSAKAKALNSKYVFKTYVKGRKE